MVVGVFTIIYIIAGFLLLFRMLEACDWEPGDSFFIRDVTTWEYKPLFQKIIIIILNIFILPWLISFKITQAFEGLFK